MGMKQTHVCINGGTCRTCLTANFVSVSKVIDMNDDLKANSTILVEKAGQVRLPGKCGGPAMDPFMNTMITGCF